MCEQQYFFEYVLGWRGPSNQKADKGTIVHKALEILAIIKKCQQDNISSFEDDVIGNVNVDDYNLDKIIEQVYEYYTSRFKHHAWKEKDYTDCYNWTYKAINHNHGMFDPRNRDILCPEQKFDIVIDKPWAKYSYDLNGEKLEGTLAIKGTIDLITRVNDSTLEIVDWKTGKRLNWATGEEKTQAKLESDPQLLIYFYAAQKLYPEIENVMVTIFFINDGGPFSMTFDKKDMAKTESMLRDKFEIIKKTQKPRLNRSWMCSKLCHFGKTTFDNTTVEPLVEYRDNQLCSKDKTMTKCEQVRHDIELKGMKTVVDEYTVPGYTVGKYKAPGSIE
jgi:hypothetical protein